MPTGRSLNRIEPNGGPRQCVVAYLGKIDEAGRLGIQQVADDSAIANQQDGQQHLFEKSEPQTEPEWIEVKANQTATGQR